MTNAAQAFVALADPTRRELFEQLAKRPASVSQLAERVPVSRPAVSQHLKVLKNARLVVDRAEGTRRIYEVDRRGLEVMRAYLDRFWDRALLAFQHEAERNR
jgi:DNA-binding transcriptional ArsR family regulator